MPRTMKNKSFKLVLRPARRKIRLAFFRNRSDLRSDLPWLKK
jgi:hypothetical protein